MTADGGAGPYAGTRPHDIDDADHFYGRDHESNALRGQLDAHRVVVVHGGTHVGKTSLIRAGLLPRFDPRAVQVLPVGRPPEVAASQPALIGDRNPFISALLSSWASGTTQGVIPGLTVLQFFQRLPRQYDQEGNVMPVVAVVDQLERVFASGPQRESHRDELLEQLVEAVSFVDRLRLVVAVRDEVVDELRPFEARLPAGRHSRFSVGPLDPDAALAAVTRPLESTARSFAPGVAEELVDDLRTTAVTSRVGEQQIFVAPTVEPLTLQIVCAALWRALPDDTTTITSEDWQEHGRVEATLSAFCAQAVAAVAAREEVPPTAIWEWLEESFVTDLGTRNSVYEGFASTGGMPNEVARAFQAEGVLRAEERSRTVRFELLDDRWIEPMRRGHAGAEYLEVDLDPATSPESHLRRAEEARAAGMAPLAEEHAWRAAEASGQEPLDPLALAGALRLLGDLAVDQGRSHTGDQAGDWFLVAEDRYRRAAELFEIEQNPRVVGRVLGSLGRLFLERRRWVDAVDALQSAIARVPDDVELRLSFARALHDSGQALAALGAYGDLLDLAPDTTEALVERGVINAERSPATALSDLDRAVRLQPDLAGRHDVVSARTHASARLQRQT